MLTKKSGFFLGAYAMALVLSVFAVCFFNKKAGHNEQVEAVRSGLLSRPYSVECDKGVVSRVITNFGSVSFIEIKSKVFAGTNVISHTFRNMWVAGVSPTNGMPVKILQFDYDFKVNPVPRDGEYATGKFAELAIRAE